MNTLNWIKKFDFTIQKVSFRKSGQKTTMPQKIVYLEWESFIGFSSSSELEDVVELESVSDSFSDADPEDIIGVGTCTRNHQSNRILIQLSFSY